MKAIHFGAGNIGRGFIGLILSQNGFQLGFADVSEGLIEELKKRRSYSVVELTHPNTVHTVLNVTAYNSVKDSAQLLNALIEADLITTAVGPTILPIIAKTLIPMLQFRAKNNIRKPLNVIACENTIGGSSQLKASLWDSLTLSEQTYCSEWVGFPNSAVDRIVPNQKNEDSLLVKVEPFYEWVIDQSQLKGTLELKGVHFTQQLDAYIERKLFTVNTGHATLAYAAYQKGYTTILEATQDDTLMELTRSVLMETGHVMIQKHGFKEDEHRAYIEKTLSRFQNPAIVDEVVRVARSPIRKLSRHDRFIEPLVEATSRHLPTQALERAIQSILKYDYTEDPEALQLQEMIQTQGKLQAFCSITGLSPNDTIAQRICA